MNYRKVKYEYFQVVFRNDGDPSSSRDRLFDLTQWMDRVKGVSLKQRARDYMGEQARLEETYYDQDLDYFFLHFVRLRSTNIPSRAKLDEAVEPIELEDDEYIGEEVSALYDDDKHILMLQRNRHSLAPSGIAEYFNLMWDEEDETIYLRPIAIPNAFDIAKKQKIYRRINVRFADLKKARNQRAIDRLKSPIKKIINSFGEYDGINAQISITVGQPKDNRLDEETVKDTIDDIENNVELFSGVQIAMKDNEDTRVEILDLFDGKAHDFATFRMEAKSSLNHYAIAESMWKIFHPKKGNRQAEVKSYLRD